MNEEIQHISHRYDEELNNLCNLVVNMGNLAIKQVENGLQALYNLDVDLAKIVIDSDFDINNSELKIDARCAQILARRQPVAGDLRLIIAIIKITTDIERIGDEAQKLGKFALKISKENSYRAGGQFKEMTYFGELVVKVIKKSLDVFKNMNLSYAFEVINNDEKLDDANESVLRQLITRMMEDPREIRNNLRVSWASRALERIGDHAKNICEYVVYIIEAEDIRHK